VRTNTGNATYNGSVQFSIPQFGDFFSDMVVNIQHAATQATLGTVPAFPALVGPDNPLVTSTSSSSGLANVTTGVFTRYTHEYVDVSGNVLTVGAPARNFVRYCEYPGQRIFKKVKFDVNGELIAMKSTCAAA